MDRLLKTTDVAEYLGIAVSTVMQYRTDGNGPLYIKVGRLVRYRMSDIDAWLKTKTEQACQMPVRG